MQSRNCVVCKRDDTHEKYLANKDADHQRTKEWRRQNRQRHRQNAKQWARRNIEKRRAIGRNYNKRWRIKLRPYSAMMCAIRHRRMKNATPIWVNIRDILKFYEDAQRRTCETGIQHHVDHIMPIAGRTSCGLNVPWNLQVITASENLRKYNKVSECELTFSAPVGMDAI